MARLTLRDLARLHAEGSKITMLTAYDASFARVLDAKALADAGASMIVLEAIPAAVARNFMQGSASIAAAVAAYIAAVKNGTFPGPENCY